MNTLLAIERTTALFAVLFFVLAYAILAPWWRSEIGRNVMAWSGSAAMLLFLAVLQQIFGPAYWGRDLLVALGFAGFIAAAVWRLVMLLKAQRSNHTEVHKPEGRSDVE